MDRIKEDVVQFRQFVKELYENSIGLMISKETVIKILMQMNKDFEILNLN